jgi:hypothetical protein
MAASTVALPASAAHLVPKGYEMGIFGTPMVQPIATTSLDDVGDTVELGFVPGNCTILGFVIQATALAASALVYKIQVNGNDVVTTLTVGGTNAAGGSLVIIPSAPLAIAGGVAQKVQMVVTTVATTPAAGSISVTPIMVNQ